MLSGILNRLGYEKRNADPSSPYAPHNWGRAVAPSGGVSPQAVLSNLATAARCVALRSELMAGVPLHLYRRLPNGDRERVTDNPLAQLLNEQFNEQLTAFEGRELLVRSLDLHGNAYLRIVRDSAGRVVSLEWLEPTRVQIERLGNGRLRYRYSGDRGSVVLLQEEVLHIRGPSSDGVTGLSPIQIARGALALGINLNETAGTLARDGFRPAAVLTHPGKLSEQARANVREMVEVHNSGPAYAGRPLVLQEGMTLAPWSFNAADSELLESRKLSAEDVARIFNVPPASVGISSSVSYGSAQQAAADLVQNSLAPLAARIEQAIARCCLTSDERRTLYVEHGLSGLLRSDAASRWATYKTAREIGVMSAAEIRRTENLGPMDPSDDYSPVRATTPQPADTIASVK